MAREVTTVGGRKQNSMSPCAACKLLRRRCASDCIFAPYFPSDEPQKFANVHKVFGASNVNKMLQDLPVQQRGDAVSSMVYEANARVRDPVYGCVGAISSLQHQVALLQTQLAMAQAEIIRLTIQQHNNGNQSSSPVSHIAAMTKLKNDRSSSPISEDDDSSSPASVKHSEAPAKPTHFYDDSLWNSS